MSSHEVKWDDLWSDEAQQLRSSSLASLVHRFTSVPGVIGMHGGLPPASAFPVTAIDLHLADGCSKPESSASSQDNPSSILKLSDPTKMYLAQQYHLNPRGYVPLAEWCMNMTQRHKPLRPVEVALTAGAVNAVYLITSLLANAGDSILVEEFTFSHIYECVFLQRGLVPVGVAMDEEGMLPEALEQAIHSAPRKPRLLYIIPNGHNPTSINYSPARKRAIYKVAQKHDLLIIEDDAYYWIQFETPSQSHMQPTSENSEGLSNGAHKLANGVQPSSEACIPGPDDGIHASTSCTQPRSEAACPGVEGLAPGMLSLDTDGRVIRVDTFAKVIGPGCRLGWVSAHPALIQKIRVMVGSVLNGVCSMTAVMVSELLNHWGEDGFDKYLRRLQHLYGSNAAVALQAAEENLKGVATWYVPTSGMFMWLKLTPTDSEDGASHTRDFGSLIDKLVENKVVAVPGEFFRVKSWSGESEEKVNCPYFRVAFSNVNEADLKEGFARLGAALRVQ